MARQDATAVARWLDLAIETIAARRDVINEANVFPVADSDTGTNIILTLQAAADAVAELDPNTAWAPAVSAAARGALVGARGNSGVILSAYLAGCATTWEETGFSPDDEDPSVIVDALLNARRRAKKAVSRPAPGTMITGANRAAKKARKKLVEDPDASTRTVLKAAVRGADQALHRSPEKLAVLRSHGVKDAGAFGMAILVAALATTLTGRDHLEPYRTMELTITHEDRSPDGALQPDDPDSCALDHHHHEHDPNADLEVMILLGQEGEAPARTEAFAQRLESTGDSLTIVRSGGLVTVHIHTDDPVPVWQGLSDVPGSHLQRLSVRALHDTLGPAKGMIVVADHPSLLADLARSGAVAYHVPGDDFSKADLARAVIDSGQADVVVVAPQHILDRLDPIESVSHAPVGSDLELVATVIALSDFSLEGATGEDEEADPQATQTRRAVDVAQADVVAIEPWPSGTPNEMTRAIRSAVTDSLGTHSGMIVALADTDPAVSTETFEVLDAVIAECAEHDAVLDTITVPVEGLGATNEYAIIRRA